VQLEREPDNKYDGYAIKTLVGGVHIGYIPASTARNLAPMLEDGLLEKEAAYIETEIENGAIYPVINLQFVEGEK